MMTTRRRCVYTDSPGQTVYASTVGPCSHSDTRTHLRTHTHIHTHEVSGCVPDATEDSHKRRSGLRYVLCEESAQQAAQREGQRICRKESVCSVFRARATLAGWLVMLNRLTHVAQCLKFSISEQVCSLNFFYYLLHSLLCYIYKCRRLYNPESTFPQSQHVDE